MKPATQPVSEGEAAEPERITARICGRCSALVAGQNNCPYCGNPFSLERGVEYIRADANQAEIARLREALKEINDIANKGYADHAQQDKERIAELSCAALALVSTEGQASNSE